MFILHSRNQPVFNITEGPGWGESQPSINKEMWGCMNSDCVWSTSLRLEHAKARFQGPLGFWILNILNIYIATCMGWINVAAAVYLMLPT